MKAQELIKKYGIETSLIIVGEIIKEYDDNICYRGYDNDYDMWDAQKEEWEKVKFELEELT